MNKTLFVIMLVMLVNSLSYGIMIPLFYPFAQQFSINYLTVSLLFSVFSVFQFIANPIIGRLSDLYGRKYLLLICLLGTSASMALFAAAGSVTILFLARILDGITGGNMSVAQAMIADSSTQEEKTKNFGILGASFGFGFLFGPAIGGFLSQYSLATPFWFASFLALASTLIGWVLLPETNKSISNSSSQIIFPFSAMIKSFGGKALGVWLLISLVLALSHNAWVIGFQTFSFEKLFMSPNQIGITFTLAGAFSIASQMIGLKFFGKLIKRPAQLLSVSTLIAGGILSLNLFADSTVLFASLTIAYVFFFSMSGPLISSIISKQAHKTDQGSVLGVNQSVISMRQIFGPILGGLIITGSFSLLFALNAMMFFFAGYLAYLQLKVKVAKVDI